MPHSSADPNHEASLTVAQFARRHSVSVRTVQTWIADGRLPVVRFSRRTVRILESAAAAFVASCANASEGSAR